MSEATSTRRLRRQLALPLAALLATAGLGLSAASTAEQARVIPAYAGDAQAEPTAGTEVAVLAGGCFWGVQGVFQHVEGVLNAVSGYAGGEQRTAQYELVTSGATGHAEAVQVTYDPRKIDFAGILQIYFSVAHDPTQLDRQGPDRGTQYRSAIFPANPAQARIAATYIAQLDQARAYDAAIVTRIETDRPFYAAEDYHQDFMTKHPTYPYIVVHDAPKLEALKRVFPGRYRNKPVLVSEAARGGARP